MDVALVPRQGESSAQSQRRFVRLRPLVSVIVPTLNEAQNLPGVFERLPRDLHEVIVVDGGSNDATIATARGLRPQVRVLRQLGSGKGDALALGFAAASGDIVVTVDADGSTDPRDIPRFVATLGAGADVVKGSRFLDGGGSDDLTRLRRIGARALTALVNLLFGTEYTDVCFGYTAFWRRTLGQIATAPGFEVEASMCISAARAGLDVVELASFERKRVHGESKLHAVRDGLRILVTILGARVQRRADQEPVEAPASA